MNTRLALPLHGLSVLCVMIASVCAQEINPYTRQVLRSERVQQWAFQNDAAGWTASHDCSISNAADALRITCAGCDPYLSGPPVLVEGPLTVRLRMKCATEGPGQIFWAAPQSPHMDEARSRHFQIIHDGRWHDYAVPLDVNGPIAQMRLDPGTAPGSIELAGIELVRDILHPLEIQSVRSEGRCVTLVVTNHSDKAMSCSVGGTRQVVAANAAETIAQTAPGRSPFGVFTAALQADGLPALKRDVFFVDAGATADWVSLRSGDVMLNAARDGSGARIELAGKLVGFLAPLVWRDGIVPKLKLSGDGSRLRFTGEGVDVTVALRAGEISVAIASEVPCEGPVLRTLGSLEQGLFAGLEYLDKGESSSSTLDIETAEHIRFAPDPLKVTMPLMAFVTDRATAAMTWEDMGLQPVYATPDFLDGAEGHRAALRGKKIEATILVRKPAPLEEAILWAVGKCGLPPLPKPPRGPQAQADLCLKALNGPLKTAEGWGHCAEPGWPRRWFSDHASTIWRLTGEVPAAPALVPGGSHIRNDAIYFVTGRADQWLAWKKAQTEKIIAGQQADGSWRYDGPYRRGHCEDTSSGLCAHNAMALLDYAWVSGDKAALAAGVRALDFVAQHFRSPLGAQTWECPLHTPDILASAMLVWGYTRGYELAGRKEYLDQARRWALSGVPFVYLWGQFPVMSYATIAVYGATNWKAPNWMGLPVQWCGYDYAYALALLAPYDNTLDWKRLAEGILITAEQMQCPDGTFAGCEPDSFALAAQKRNGPMINPCAIVSLRMVLGGKLDSLAVAAEAGHRVAAPFPVTIRGGKAHIRAPRATDYQVLVDGRVVNIHAQGDDTVALE